MTALKLRTFHHFHANRLRLFNSILVIILSKTIKISEQCYLYPEKKNPQLKRLYINKNNEQKDFVFLFHNNHATSFPLFFFLKL